MAYGTVIRGNKADVICRIAFNNAFFLLMIASSILDAFLIKLSKYSIDKKTQSVLIQFFWKKEHESYNTHCKIII